MVNGSPSQVGWATGLSWPTILRSSEGGQINTWPTLHGLHGLFAFTFTWFQKEME